MTPKKSVSGRSGPLRGAGLRPPAAPGQLHESGFAPGQGSSQPYGARKRDHAAVPGLRCAPSWAIFHPSLPGGVKSASWILFVPSQVVDFERIPAKKVRRMKRRDFVKSISAVGAGMLLRPGSPHTLLAQEAKPDPAVKRVLVMFKCHFDAGFVDTQTAVVHKYFSEYFPQAIEIARAQNAAGKRRYVWTTGSWLLYEYLEQASPAERKAMEQAIVKGDIAWHALPFTWQTELLSQSMIEGSLSLSNSLDHRFGAVTTGAKMTDVPGHTRAIVPPLAKHGITFLEIGINGGS